MQNTKNKNVRIVGLTCTNGRFSYLERLLACFVNQEYEDKELLIFNNSNIKIQMDPMSNVKLINNHLDYVTGKPYTNVGSIYRDALHHLCGDYRFLSIMDDDDIFLPNHFVMGVEALTRNPHYKVWRPGCYFFKNGCFDVEFKETDLNLEGSCIIDYKFIKEVGFEIDTSLEYNLKWLLEASRNNLLYNDPSIIPSFCCEYGQNDVFHISSYFYQNPQSSIYDLENNTARSKDFGVGKVLKPWDKDRLFTYFDTYFNLENFENVE